MGNQAILKGESMDDIITIEEGTLYNGAKIRVVGVGGGGNNMISHIIRSGAHNDIELIAANTDAQHLNNCLAPNKIQLGQKLTKGLGAGMRPETGKESALESIEDIKKYLLGSDIVFIGAGLGGGTGTGAAPIIAQAAKEIGALTVSIVTKPFRFEGNKRAQLADRGLQELKKESDSIVVIPNDKLLSIIDKGLGLKDSFKIVDNVLARAVNGISGVILNYGDSDINVDFADLRTVMGHRGLALMGIGESSGSNAATEAIKNAIESPLFDNMSINGAMGVLINFNINPGYPLQEIGQAMELIYENVGSEADVIFGTTTNEDIELDSVKITIVATGFEKELIRPESQHAAKERSNLRLLTPNDDEEPVMQTNSKPKISGGNSLRRVSGGDYEEQDGILDIPTIFRKQMD